MPHGERPLKEVARHSWVAFCTGWWFAGVILGFGHFLDLVARPSPDVLEAAGVSVVMGAVLPGGAPFWLAAEVVGARGLPVGFTGLLLGAVLAFSVWVSLPIALLSGDHSQDEQPATRALLVVAVLPYLGSGAGLVHLSRTFRTRGQTPLRAGALAFAAAVSTYVIGAVLVFTVGIVFVL